MSDHHRLSTDYADITHAVLVHAVGASRLREGTAPDGGPLFLLTAIGFCRCGAEDEIERSLLLRESEVVNIIASLTDSARLVCVHCGAPAPCRCGHRLIPRRARRAGRAAITSP